MTLSRGRLRSVLTPVRVAVVTAVVVLVVVILSVPLLGGVSHVLFRTDRVDATVVRVSDAGGSCLGATEYDYAFSWRAEGERHTAAHQLCGKRFQAFEETTIWIDGDQVASTEPPWLAWSIWLTMTVVLAAAATWAGRRVS